MRGYASRPSLRACTRMGVARVNAGGVDGGYCDGPGHRQCSSKAAGLLAAEVCVPAHVRPLQLPHPRARILQPLSDLQRAAAAACINRSRRCVIGKAACSNARAERTGRRRRRSPCQCCMGGLLRSPAKYCTPAISACCSGQAAGSRVGPQWGSGSKGSAGASRTRNQNRGVVHVKTSACDYRQRPPCHLLPALHPQAGNAALCGERTCVHHDVCGMMGSSGWSKLQAWPA